MHVIKSLPFVFMQQSNTVNTNDVIYTRDNIHGLLRLENTHLHVQWRLTRKVDRYGVVVSSDSEQYPMREHAIPVQKLSEVRVMRTRFMIPPRKSLVIFASDLKAFDPLTGDGDLPGLALAHPAELKVSVRRQDHQVLEDFANHLRTVISEQVLELMEKDMKQLESLEQETASTYRVRTSF